MKLIRNLPRWLTSKYFIAGVSFVIWMFFFDRNDIPLQQKRVNELRSLQKSEKAFNQQISQTKEELNLLKTNPSTLEKYAREKYLMKKDNEDIFIFK
ncbi:septum formation initiator family protein [soil metagenome]